MTDIRYKLEINVKATALDNCPTYAEAMEKARGIADEDHIVKIVMKDFNKVIGKELVTA